MILSLEPTKQRVLRLREYLATQPNDFDENSPLHHLRIATDELSTLVCRVAELHTWYLQGRAIVKSSRMGYLFSLGVWWAKNPWQKPTKP